MMKHWPAFGRVLAAVAFGVPAAAQMNMPMPAATATEKAKIPTMIADQSKAKSLPLPSEPGTRGFGIRAVDGQTLASMKAHCATSGIKGATAMARCDQLRRTLQTTPGNTR